jgi:signal transduction histidine kinase
MSLRLKLVLLVSSLTIVLLGGLGLYLGGSMRAWTTEVVDEELSRRARGLSHEVEYRHGRLEVDDDDLKRRGWPFRVEREGGGALITGSAGWPLTSTPALGYTTVEGADGAPLRVLSLVFEPHHGRGEQLTLRVAAPLSLFAGIAERFRLGMAVALVLAALLGALGAALLAQVFLGPLRRLSQAVAGVEASSLGTRLETTGLGPELGRLAATFNGVLGRLAGAFDAQRAFVGRASHALRTPLASILSQAEVALLRERSPEAYRAALTAVAEAARDSARLADGLLALTRADDAVGRGAERESVDLAQLAAELERLFLPRAETAGLRFSASAGSGLTVGATRGRLRELLDALIDNALRYTPRGGTVRFEAREDGGGAVVLEVEDTGLGITPEERAQVFERFFRGSAAVKSGQGGSGLGLALVKALSEAEGARLSLEAPDGGGTRVRVVYPGSTRA